MAYGRPAITKKPIRLRTNEERWSSALVVGNRVLTTRSNEEIAESVNLHLDRLVELLNRRGSRMK